MVASGSFKNGYAVQGRNVEWLRSGDRIVDVWLPQDFEWNHEEPLGYSWYDMGPYLFREPEDSGWRLRGEAGVSWLPDHPKIRLVVRRHLTLGEFLGRWMTYILGAAIVFFAIKIPVDMIGTGLGWKLGVFGTLFAAVGAFIGWMMIEQAGYWFGDFY